MALALYRRYRPDTFDGVIGQDQVTVPLMRALDEGKLTHAYLFSGPRGCGKTSSARILARCVNCAKGPTSHPCGECESCRDLATGGPGSIDVMEIDAASHNKVEDTRELRERAGFAPARDRYKIFILDEAHMVTPSGFNALLKIVEEPPEHVMFIFATTEPDKVIGTIRSRTHHYPFRLVPQEVMGPYLETVCEQESIKPEPGVLKLAMRAGGGSVRDTLSVLDQLMVGAVDGSISYDSAVALLGFTPETLIGEAVDAVIDRDGESLYQVIQKVVVGGFEPRRFVEDLLARVRDLLVLKLAGERAESVLSDTAESEDMDDLRCQASALGLPALTSMAETINTTLSTMAGAISPRMRLELLAARLLAGREGDDAAASAPAGAGVSGAAGAVRSADAASPVRAGFAGSSRGGFAGAARNQRSAQSAPTTAPERHEQSDAAHPVSPSHLESSVAATQAPQTDDIPQARTGEMQVGAGAGAVQPTDAVQSAAAGRTAANGAQIGAEPHVVQPPQADHDASASQMAAQTASQAVASPNAAKEHPAAESTAPAGTPDERWDALVAALPQDVRHYVGRDRVPRINLAPNKRGRMQLWIKFDKPLSKYAFAMAVTNEAVDGANKVVDILRAEVRKVFGPDVALAPTRKMADGQEAPPWGKLPADEQRRIKAQLLQQNLSAATHPVQQGGAGSDHATPQADGVRSPSSGGAATSPASSDATSDDDASHRDHSSAVDGTPADDVDPWAQPPRATQPTATTAARTPSTSASPEAMGHADGNADSARSAINGHRRKPVAVPDLSDDDDPWNQPIPVSAGVPAGAADAGTAAPRTMDDDPWNQPMPVPHQSAQSDDPWAAASAAAPAVPSNPQTGGQTEAHDSGYPAGTRAIPQSQRTPGEPQVPPDDDEYSMSDESLGTATAMSIDDLRKFFEVKKVEEFAADDPKNPKNLAQANKRNE